MTADPANPVAPVSTPASVPRWVRALPVIVLLIAIAAQAILMATVNIDRQTGSGFAMFSSVDFAGSRSVVVTAVHGGTPVQVSVPAELDDHVEQLLYAPTDTRAHELAVSLAGYQWGEQNGRVSADRGNAAGPITNVVVSVRALTADGHNISSHVLADGSFE